MSGSDEADDRDPPAPIRIPGSTPSPARRFFTQAKTIEADGQHRVLLDGRPVRTPARRIVEVARVELAAALASEWQAQGALIDPRTMPLTRLVNSALDGVTGREAEVAADIARYAGNDVVCYRAEHPPGLVARQAAAWDPLLAWADAELGGRLATARGIMHVTQDAALLERLAARLANRPPLQLAALHTMTTLTGSAVLALAHACGHIDVDAAWAAAHVDEDWQVAHWGEDAEATERRRLRRVEMDAASLVHALGA